jgi:xylulose-5-phosphate/fructose-6-phosphate phosphoketolase
VWEWVSGKEASKNPDVVMASCGDYMTQEAIYAVKLCKQLIPELKIRFVNVSELTSLCLGDLCKGKDTCNTEVGVNYYFTADKPVVFNYHGYVNDIEHILWQYASSDRFSIHGYHERGSTTTPFDLKVLNQVSCYDLAIDLIGQAAKKNKQIAKERDALCDLLRGKITEHQAYIREHGEDMPEVNQMRW